MGRYVYQNHFTDRSGNAIETANITIYNSNSTVLATVYSSSGSSTAKTGSVVSTAANGFFSFWVDTDDYNENSKFKIDASKINFTTQTYDDIQILPDKRIGRVSPTYGATVSINARLGNVFEITANNNTAFTISNPTNGVDNQAITLKVINTNTTNLGAITWGSSYKLAAWTSPATLKQRAISFHYNGTYWREISRTTVDIPNT